MSIIPLCIFCQYKGDGLKCKAYPKEIPDAILYGTHFYPKPVDHGIQFKQSENTTKYPSWFDVSQEEEDKRYREYENDDNILVW